MVYTLLGRTDLKVSMAAFAGIVNMDETPEDAARFTAYAVKAGVNSLTQTAAAAFIGKNIRVNALLPGLAETKLSKPIFEYARNKGSEHKLGKLTLMQRPGYVEDMAGVIAFLASDDSSYVDGQLIACDGGISATHPFGRFA